MRARGRVRSWSKAVSRRAWNRAGILVDGLAASPRRRTYSFSWRLAMHLTGCALIAVAVAAMLWNEFGPGPLDVMIGAIRDLTGLSLTFAVWATTGTLLLVAWALGRRPGFGNLVTILTIGPLMQLALARFDQIDAPDATVAKIAVHVLATALIGLGAGMNVFANLGAGTSELLTSATAQRIRRREPHVRMAFELTWLGLGALLGGPLGLGTVIVAVLIGPFVARGYRTVDSAYTTAREATLRQIAASRPPVDITGQIPVMSLSAGE